MAGLHGIGPEVYEDKELLNKLYSLEAPKMGHMRIAKEYGFENMKTMMDNAAIMDPEADIIGEDIEPFLGKSVSGYELNRPEEDEEEYAEMELTEDAEGRELPPESKLVSSAKSDRAKAVSTSDMDKELAYTASSEFETILKDRKYKAKSYKDIKHELDAYDNVPDYYRVAEQIKHEEFKKFEGYEDLSSERFEREDNLFGEEDKIIIPPHLEGSDIINNTLGMMEERREMGLRYDDLKSAYGNILGVLNRGVTLD